MTATHEMDPRVERVWRTILAPLRAYHRYEAVGLEHIPRTGPVLLVVSHSLATYDAFLLGMAIVDQVRRVPLGLGDDNLFRFPGLRTFALESGLRPASPGAAHALLDQGELVSVAPGGTYEALRPSTERYTVRWETRRGFCRLALRAQVPMVFAGCGAADDLYTVYPSPLTEWVYRKARFPAPLARGVGLSLMPRPARLRHFVSEPLQPPAHAPEREAEQVEALHARSVQIMQDLLAKR